MEPSEFTTVIVVGAGPAGIGIATLLKHCSIDCIVLERGRIGESMLRWPAETRFISPSFTGNFFGVPDLNAITPDSSPAYGLQTEHPTGVQYCRYLNDVATTVKLDVRTNTEVLDVTGFEPHPAPKAPTEGAPHTHDHAHAHDDHHHHHDHTHCEHHDPTNVEEIDLDKIPTITVNTSRGLFTCKFFVWAGGEFQFPKTIPNTVRAGASYADMPVGKHVLIGGNESGMDAALNLIRCGSEVTILDERSPWAQRVSDSSYGLSPATLDNLREIQKSGRATFVAERATEISDKIVTTATRTWNLEHPAIDCTGFDIKQSVAGKLFDFNDNDAPVLRMQDESSRFKNVFFTGPWVHHGKTVFCFVYKYRQRWAVVVRAILNRMGLADPGPIRSYAERGFLLEDLSHCSDACLC